MNANHRDLAKFENAQDSNYRSLRNRLASTIQQIRQESLESQVFVPETRESQEPSNPSLPLQSISPDRQLDTIALYLSMDYSHDETLASLNDTRLGGSCSWLLGKPSYLQWQASHAPRYYWLKGASASGKSTMASYVVDQLKNFPVCFYFFKSGEKTVPNLSSFLRSMAYQMARANPVICNELFQLAQNQQPIDIRNHRSIWHNVFTSCVFHVDLKQP